MDWLWYLLLLAAMMLGLALVVLTLPGVWVMIGAAAVYGWMTEWRFVGPWTLLTLTGIGAISEIIELIAGSAGAKKAGGSRRAAVGALVGGLVGAIVGSIILPIPAVGAIAGACIGAFAGAVVMEFTKHGGTGQSWRVGVGAAKGKFVGIVSKVAFGVIILLIAALAAAPLPWRRTAPAQSAPPATAPR